VANSRACCLDQGMVGRAQLPIGQARTKQRKYRRAEKRCGCRNGLTSPTFAIRGFDGS
jgi:hypothetical protein